MVKGTSFHPSPVFTDKQLCYQNNLASRFFPLLFTLLIIGVPPSYIQAQSLLLEGESYRVDKKTQRYTYHNPRVVLGDSTILADQLVYDKKAEILDFTGNVLVKQSGILLTAKKAKYLIDQEKLILNNATLFDEKQQAYAEAKIIEKLDREKFKIIEGTVTLCNPEKPAWIFEATEIVYEIDNFAYARNSRLTLYNIPIFYSPFIAWPTRQGRASGFLAPTFKSQLGNSDSAKNWGYRLEIPYFLEFGQEQDLTITADLMSSRGPGFGADYNYAFIPGMQGQFNFWYLDESVQDRSVKYEDLGSITSEDIDLQPVRYKYDFNHRQNIFLGGQLFYQQWLNSDNEINREFFGSAVDKDLHQAQNLNLVFPWQNGGLTVSAQTRENFLYNSIYDHETDKNTHLNTLPGISVTHRLDRLGGTNATLSMEGGLTQYHRIEGWRGLQGTDKAHLRYPFHLSFLNILPEYTHSAYRYDLSYKKTSSEVLADDFDEEPAPYGWDIDQKQLELNLEFYKLYNNENNEAVGRLSFRPRLVYKEVEDVEQNGFSFASSVLGQENVALHWETLYQTKNPSSGKVQNYLQFNIIQIYDLLQIDEDRIYHGPRTATSLLETEVGDSRLPLRLELILTPVSYFSSSLFFRYNAEKGKIVETRASANVTSVEGEKLTFSYSNNTKQYHELDGTNHNVAKTLSIAHNLNLNDNLKFKMGGTWDLSRTDLATQYAASNSTKRIDRQLTSAFLNLIFNEDCYQVSLGYFETIDTRSVDGSSEEYLNRRLNLNFTLSGWPAGSGTPYDYNFLDL
ncbi:MAG: LPS-assembly protein LptD [Proteobacteria bacterium]|nr:LPS-assembly protein LptD [Pseudomonadota bacterium]